MITQSAAFLDTRVLVLAPSDADAEISRVALTDAGIQVMTCRTLRELCLEAQNGVGTVLLTDDAILKDEAELLVHLIENQPVWSDLPIVLMTEGGITSRAAAFALEKFGNVMLLDCPSHLAALISILRVALRERQRQYEIREYQTRILKQAKELEQFAYVASHDLQEPLRKIATYTDLIKEKFQSLLDGEGQRYLETIFKSSVRMKCLINDLLTYSRLNQSNEETKAVDLNTTIANVKNDLDTTISDHGAEITAEPMPIVSANPFQMHQLFQNLIANAIKYNDKDHPVIRISAIREENFWHLSVSDNGIGIDQRYSEKIFQVFQRLHGIDKYPGTGIGLAICKKIVDAHGGRIWLESVPGEGSVFNLTLPAVRNSENTGISSSLVNSAA